MAQSQAPADQNSGAAANSTTTTTTTDQNAPAANADQNAPAADQGAKNDHDRDNKKLPQTGSELPLLGLLGLGTVSAGVWKAYYKK